MVLISVLKDNRGATDAESWEEAVKDGGGEKPSDQEGRGLSGAKSTRETQKSLLVSPCQSLRCLLAIVDDVNTALWGSSNEFQPSAWKKRSRRTWGRCKILEEKWSGGGMSIQMASNQYAKGL